ncbi:hypothetical protein KIK06_25420 [Nocardiopsis sp. EMB25]|uniref:hypothetical protein n=1 Tax=Nocardiopsis sp. EMB25 TaxID=2835867 RepID=UPI0022839B92|nr:hypothetical protein [Nocardiopsis sp. EMB25]MCY9787226.1 hypothetical protein [Nocardiopsis sp. EMB25]
MTLDQYTAIFDALTYAVHSTAHRRDPKSFPVFLAARDEFAVLYPEHRNAYIPAGER